MPDDVRTKAFNVVLPSDEAGPMRRIALRVGVALSLIVIVALIAYLGRDGYVDPEDGSVSLGDAFYYSTVSITTTGYGDVRPVSDEARLMTTLVVTPLRVLFLIILVGTTLEILAERSRLAYRISRWRKRLNNHVIVCGYGSKGRSAVRTLLGKGIDPSDIVVIDQSPSAREQAEADGLASVAGNASAAEILEEASIKNAAHVVVAVDRDDAAVLATLTARELAPNTRIAVAVREEENVHLLRQSGANSVITTSGAAGRLLGLSAGTPALVEVLEDLLNVGEGLDVVETVIGDEQAGSSADSIVNGPVIAVIRAGELLPFNDPRLSELATGDRLVELHSHPA